MNGENACRTSEARRSGSFHSDLERLSSPSEPPASRDVEREPFAWRDSFSCAAPSEAPHSEAPPSSGRSEAVTHPYEGTSMTPPPASCSTALRDWCVDAGHEKLAMTTFELWEALERGQVVASMRVWREGLECWTPVGEIPDFSWAVASTPEPPTDTPVASGEDAPSERLVDVPTPPPESGFRASVSARGAGWIPLRSAVAIVAVVTAIGIPWAPVPPPVASAGAAFQPAPVVVLERSLPASEAAHHDERGQRRLPRGGRRAYGR
jgi:hypothetical protein